MKKQNIQRIFKTGLSLFRRNVFLGLSSVSVTVVTLTVILALFFTQAILSASLHAIESRVDITLYISDSADDSAINDIKTNLELMPEVKNVEFFSKEEALVLFRERNKGDSITNEALEEISKNPLPASFVIHAKDTAQYDAIINKLENESTFLEQNKSFITKINFARSKQVIDKILVLRDGVNKFGYTLTLIFIIIAILVTFNTVKLSIYTMKDEIDVMRLVGASSNYIRGPFIVAQALYSLVAGLITLVIFLGLTYILRDTLTVFFGVDLFDYYIKNIFQIAGIVLFSGLILGTLSSLFAVGRYLRK
jgi:cell division transport system permease protein